MNINKRIVSVVLLLMIIFSLSFSFAQENSKDNLKANTTKKDLEEKGDPNNKENLKSNHKMTRRRINGGFSIHLPGWGRWEGSILSHVYIDDKTAFCLQPNKESGNNVGGFQSQDFIQSGYSQETRDKLSRIVYCGWDTSNKTEKDYLSVKFMVWEALGWKIDNIWGTLTLGEYKVKRKNILAKIEDFNKKPSFNTKEFTVLKGNTLTVKDDNNVLSQMVFSRDESTNTIVVNGNTITKNGNSLIIKANGTSVDKVFLKKVPKKHEGSSLVYYKDNYYQKVAIFKVLDPVYSFLKLNVKAINGKIKLIKYNTDETKILGGAVFEVRNSSGKVVDTIKSSSKGYVYSKALPLGKYTIKEIKAPEGYALNGYTWTRTLKSNGVDEVVYSYPITAHDRKVMGKIKLIKYNSDETEILAGAEFEVKNSEGKVVDTIVTTSKGYSYSKLLPLGIYIVKEIKAPDGYVNSGANHEMFLESNGVDEIVYSRILKIVNKAIKGKIKIVKKDGKTNDRLKGSIFEIRGKEDNVLYERLTTNEAGEAESKLLGVGSYIVREVSAPKGYVLNDNPVVAQISGDGTQEVVELTYSFVNFKRPLGIIEIEKSDSLSGDKLAGVKFNILDKDAKLIQTIVTNDSGIAKSKKLELGKYTIKEVESLNGYITDENEYDAELKADGNNSLIVYRLNITNKPIQGVIRINKYNEKKDLKLKGAVFLIKDSDKKTVAELITDDKGYAESKSLPLGNYTIVESKAPIGYVLSDKIYEVTLEAKDNKEVVYYKLDVVNKSIKAPVEITKLDISTKEPIPNCEIAIYKENGELVESKVTDINGIAKFKELSYGNYFFLEKSAPKGYKLNKEKHHFKIHEDGKIIKSTLEDEIIENDIKIVKEDKETGERLKGCTIEIRNADTNKIVFTGVTNSKGELDVRLRFGEYTFKELKAPKGYLLSSDVGEFSVKDSTEQIVLKIKNVKEIFPKTGFKVHYYNYIGALVILFAIKRLF